MSPKGRKQKIQFKYMHSHNHNSKHIDHKDLAKRLQNEVEQILTNVDNKMLYAEFREDEVFTIQKGESQEVIHNTLDERIFMQRQPRETTLHMIDRHTTKAARKVNAWARLMHYLFKPLHY
jgi:hypothetical protein